MSLIPEKQVVGCLVCGEPAEKGDLCALHHVAEEKLKQNYKRWDVAYGGLSYRDYLRFLVSLPETGEAVGALARFVLRDKGEGNVEDANRL